MADVELQRESFVFYNSFYSAIITLPEEEQLLMFKAVIERALFGKEPSLKGCAKGMYDLISPQLKANERRYLNGCKGGKYGVLGGRPPKNPKETPNKPQNNPKETPNDNVNVNDNENANVNDNVNFKVITPTAPKKHKYGTHNNVLLTDEEYLKLQERFPTDYDEKINTLSEGLALKGYKYKSHYLAVIKWAKNETPKATKPTASSNPFLDLLKEG